MKQIVPIDSIGTIIKVCGMREAENIRAVEALGIEMMGFIFWDRSKRYVSHRPAYLPTQCRRIGVFVDADISQLIKITEEYGLDGIQLHGHESPQYIRQLQAAGIRAIIIKAFNIATAEDFEQTAPYHGMADCFLFDTKGKTVGGNGVKFDWNCLGNYCGETPFLLSGGIAPEDAETIRQFRHHKCIGIDLNSRFEKAPGLKDIEKLKTFIHTVKQ